MHVPRQAALYLVLTVVAANSLTALAAEFAADALSPAGSHRTTRQLARSQLLTHRAALSSEAKPPVSARTSPSHEANSPSASSAFFSLSSPADKEHEVKDGPSSRHAGLSHQANSSHARSHREAHHSPADAAGRKPPPTTLAPPTPPGFLPDTVDRADDHLQTAHEAAEEHQDSMLDVSGDVKSHPSLSGGPASSSAIPLSTHQCWWEGTPEEEASEALTAASQHTVCNFTNLLIWNQQVTLPATKSNL